MMNLKIIIITLLLARTPIIFKDYSFMDKLIIQQWHYLQYEYGRTGVGEEKMLVKIYFFNSLGLQQGSFGNARRRASFINSNFYLFFGGDDDSQVLLKAETFDFKFQYNYNENKQFMFEICHYSCLQCNGPLVNNCIACDPNSFRVLLTEQQICQCQENYIDYDGNRICQQFLGEYQSVEENEISAQLDSQCQAGYFSIKGSNNQCVQCPQQNFNFRLCVDCLYYPLTWFETLQCTIDLVTIQENGDNAYKLYQRKSIDYDLYVLDQTQNPILIEGAQEFCYDTSVSNCHETYYSLNVWFFVIFWVIFFVIFRRIFQSKFYFSNLQQIPENLHKKKPYNPFSIFF